MTLSGTNFTGATSVTFDGVPGTSLTVNSATSITVTAPAGTAGAKTVAVTTPGGTATLNSGYTYLAPQTVSFTSTAPVGAVIGDTYSVTASATSALTPVITVDAGSAAICSIAGGTVTFNAQGTCVLNANQSGNSTYAAATQVQQSIVVGLAPQTVSFTSTVPVGAVVGDTYAVTASATSSLTPVITVDGSSSSICSLAGGTVTFNAQGTCVLNANQSGNSTYAAATQVQQSIVVGLVSQTVSFTSTSPVGAVVGDTYAVTASATSSLIPVITVDGSSSSICSIAGGTVTFNAQGTCVLNVNQSGNGTYSAATQVQQSITVGLAPQTVSFTSTAPAGAVIGDTYAVTASASSGLTPAITVDGSSTSICAIAGGTVTFNAQGTCVLNANQSGNSTYAAASQVQQSIVVGLAPQTVSFTSMVPTGAVIGDTYAVSASATSSLTPVITVDGSSSSICSIAGGTVTFNAQGTCVLNANQSGNSTYAAASQVQQTITVGLAPQTVSFTSTSPVGAVVGGTYAVTASATSGLTPAVTVDGSSSSICSIAGGTVTFNAQGTCVLNADQAGDSTYAVATQVQQSVAVGLAPQAVSFTSTAPVGAVIGDTYSVTASATSGLTPAVTVDGSSSSICSIAGGTVTFNAQGTCRLNADQAGDGTYAAATQVQQSIVVGLAPQTVLFTSTAPVGAVIGDTYAVTVSATSSLTPAITVDSSSTSVCSISGGTVSFTEAGTCTLNANQSGNSTYAAASQVQQSIAVGLAPQTVSFTSSVPSGAVVGDTYSVTASATSSLAPVITVDAGSTAICSIAGGTVTFNAQGTCRLNADQVGDGTYAAAAQVQQDIIVGLVSQTVAFTSTAPVGAAVGDTYAVTATATSSLVPVITVDAGSTAICSIAGGTVTFNAAGTCRLNADQAGDGTYAVATQVQQHIMVGLASQTVSFTSTAPVGAVIGDTYAVTASASSGLTPAITVDGSSTSICAIAGGTVTFNAQGTCRLNADQAGDGTYAAATQVQQSIVVGYATPVVSAVAPATGGSAGGTTIVVTGLHLATATSVHFGDTPAQSFTVDSDTQITAISPAHTPSVVDIVIVAAGGSVTVSEGYTYVQTWTALETAATVKAYSVNNVLIPQTLGAEPDALTIYTAPQNGTASVSGTTILYTPNVGFHGEDRVFYQAYKDGKVFNAAPPIVITVTAPPQITVTPAQGALSEAPTGEAYSLNVAVSGGEAPYKYTISAGALPQGVTLNADTGLISGVPETEGSYAFTVNVTDANKVPVEVSYSLNIVTPPPPSATSPDTASVPANTETQSGQSVSLSLSDLVNGQVDEIQIVTDPENGTVTLMTLPAVQGGGTVFALAGATLGAGEQVVAVYTPNPNFSGTDSFQFVAIGPGGTSAPATVTIEVQGTLPSAPSRTVTVIDGQTVSVELTEGATDGPFTAASIVSVSPADSATVRIVAGGEGSSRTYRMEITPAARFGGTIEVSYTLSNVFGESAPATITANVTARPDPSADPTVRAISDIQVETARRFSRAQVTNFMRRTESLHGADCGTSGSSVSLSGSSRPKGPRYQGDTDYLRTDERGQNNQDGLPQPPDAEMRANTANSEGGYSGASGKERCANRFAVWMGGTIELSTYDAVTDRSKISAGTSGLSFGIDRQVVKGLIMGAGFGFGSNTSEISGGDARVTSESAVVAVYGSYTPRPGSFVDAMLMHGRLDYDTRRIDATSGLTTTGKRDGWFTTGALSLGIERQSGPLFWSVYGRGEYMSGTLNPYREYGAGIYDLRFDERNLSSVTGTLGLRGRYQTPLSFGLLTTGLRVEWQHEFSDSSDQGLDYADILGPTYYSIATRNWGREQIMLSPSFELTLISGWQLGLEVGLRRSKDETASSANVQIRKPF